jgi:acyl-coenzyme A synthetase/AMP-(fatty) acid ligase
VDGNASGKAQTADRGRQGLSKVQSMCCFRADSKQFIDEVPKSPSGKIQRKVIREWAAEDSKNLTKPKAKL